MKMKAVIYARVSTTRQEISIENQIVKCSLQSQLLEDCEVVEVVQDFGISGKDVANREGFQRALHLLKTKKADTIIVYKLDRLGRNLHQIASFVAELDKLGATLLAINENINSSIQSNRLTLNILLSLAEHERMVIGSRTKDALTHLRNNGRSYSGVTPYGYKVINKFLVKNEEEIAVIKKVLDLRKNGLSLMKIAEILNEEKVKTRRGAQKWIWTAVRSIVNKNKQ